jgi:hypothetical protein
MICESQYVIKFYLLLHQFSQLPRSWRRIKEDFLGHFHKPRLDILVWILVTKLAPMYTPKLDALTSNGRHRNLASWRKPMKAEFRRCARAVLGSDPEDSMYITDPHRWTCSCPHFPTSRFLVCKHLVQACEPIHARFFQVVPARNRVAPFWQHALLVPKGGHREPLQHGNAAPDRARFDPSLDNDIAEDFDEDSDSDNSDDNEVFPEDVPYQDSYLDLKHKLLFLVAALDHNAQFTDRRMLEAARNRLSGAERFVDELLDLQARTDSHREDLRPKTWGRRGTARFPGYHTLPEERARDLQSERTAERRAAGLA